MKIIYKSLMTIAFAGLSLASCDKELKEETAMEVGVVTDSNVKMCIRDRYNTALNKDGAKANESIWEVEFAGNRSTDVRAEGRIGNIIGIQGKDLSSKASITGKGDPGYAYAFIWNTPKLLELYEANDDIDRCNWNIAPFTYTQSAGEGTPAVSYTHLDVYKRQIRNGKKKITSASKTPKC